MTKEEVYGFIRKTGFRDILELRARFSWDTELLDMMLVYLTEKNAVKRIPIRTPKGTNVLYVIHQTCAG